MGSRRVLIIAGEASADIYGAGLARALRGSDPAIQFQGMGGQAMATAGIELVEEAAQVSVVGIVEVIPALGRIIKALGSMRRTLKEWRPDLLVLIDFPDFNLRVARTARALKIPILYYVCPQVWAWRKGRIAQFRKLIDHLAVILPFEEAFWRDNGVQATYVGHPLLDLPEFGQPQSLPREVNPARRVALLPGSRRKEIDRHLPLMVAAAREMSQRDRSLRFDIALADDHHRQAVKECLKSARMDKRCRVTFTGARQLFPFCDLVIAASGTVTLEAALAKIPTVVIYKMAPVSYWIGKSVIQVPFISLPNLIAGEAIFPELIQQEASVENIVRAARTFLEDEDFRLQVTERLEEVRKRLGGGGVARRVAEIAQEMMSAGLSENRGSVQIH